MTEPWTKSLKPGDTVLVMTGIGHTVSTVERVTPTGRVVVDGVTYNPDGRQRGADKWNAPYIGPNVPPSSAETVETPNG